MPQSSPEWRPDYIVLSDVTENSSDKIFTLADKYMYQIFNIECVYTTNSTVGNRRIMVEISELDGSIIQRTITGVKQAASLTYTYYFNPTNPDLTATRASNYVLSTLPLVVLEKGRKIRVYDMNAIDTSGTGENLLVRVGVLRRRVSL